MHDATQHDPMEPTGTRSGLKAAVVAGILALALAACGGGDAGGPGDEGNDLPGGVTSGGGGGTLVFDGEEIEIADVTCVLQADTFDVGTVSDNGFRVFVSQNNPANPVSAQILDPDSIQWFPQGVSGDEASRNGSSFSSDEQTYFNNSDDRTITASFTIDCP